MHFFYHPPTEWRRLCFQSCLCIILSTRGTHVTITHHELKEPHSTGPSLYRALPPLPCPLAPVQGNPPVLTSYSQHKSAVYILLECFLVSLNTHSVMQELALVRRFCVQNPQFTLFLFNQYPLPKIKIVRSFESEVAKSTPPPPNENFRDFGSEVAKFTPSL